MIQLNTQLITEYTSFLQKKISSASRSPKFGIIQVGDDFASNTYVQIKKKKAQELGIETLHTKLPQADKSTISSLISRQNQPFIIQLPFPDSSYNELLREIPVGLDIDCLNPVTQLTRTSPTISAIQTVIGYYVAKVNITGAIESRFDIAGKNILILGQGTLVGTPLLQWCVSKQATVLSANKLTKIDFNAMPQFDIIISATGVHNVISLQDIPYPCFVIDAGTTESNGKVTGDISKKNVPDHITLFPSPGGVGPITVLSLFNAVLELM